MNCNEVYIVVKKIFLILNLAFHHFYFTNFYIKKTTEIWYIKKILHKKDY